MEDAATARTHKLHDQSIEKLKALGETIQTSDFLIDMIWLS